eukprot:RCo042022
MPKHRKVLQAVIAGHQLIICTLRYWLRVYDMRKLPMYSGSTVWIQQELKNLQDTQTHRIQHCLGTNSLSRVHPIASKVDHFPVGAVPTRSVPTRRQNDPKPLLQVPAFTTHVRKRSDVTGIVAGLPILVRTYRLRVPVLPSACTAVTPRVEVTGIIAQNFAQPRQATPRRKAEVLAVHPISAAAQHLFVANVVGWICASAPLLKFGEDAKPPPLTEVKPSNFWAHAANLETGRDSKNITLSFRRVHRRTLARNRARGEVMKKGRKGTVHPCSRGIIAAEVTEKPKVLQGQPTRRRSAGMQLRPASRSVPVHSPAGANCCHAGLNIPVASHRTDTASDLRKQPDPQPVEVQKLKLF